MVTMLDLLSDASEYIMCAALPPDLQNLFSFEYYSVD